MTEGANMTGAQIERNKSRNNEPLHEDESRMATVRGGVPRPVPGRRRRSRHFAGCAAAIRLITQASIQCPIDLRG
jgi:hypothetical protein